MLDPLSQMRLAHAWTGMAIAGTQALVNMTEASLRWSDSLMPAAGRDQRPARVSGGRDLADPFGFGGFSGLWSQAWAMPPAAAMPGLPTLPGWREPAAPAMAWLDPRSWAPGPGAGAGPSPLGLAGEAAMAPMLAWARLLGAGPGPSAAAGPLPWLPGLAPAAGRAPAEPPLPFSWLLVGLPLALPSPWLAGLPADGPFWSRRG